MSISKFIEYMRALGVRQKPKRTNVYLTNNHDILNNTATAVSWENADDNAGAWSISTPTIVTVPEGATSMRIYTHCEFQVNATGYRSLRYYVNGAGVGIGDNTYYATSITHLAHDTISNHLTAMSGLMPCTPGDEIEMMVRQNSGVTLYLNPTATAMCIEWYFD